MRAFIRATGAATPYLESNVDTDVIIRIDRLTERADLSRYAMEAVRYLPDGAADPACIFNQRRYLNAPILLAGENFGCGSSREGAVTALMAMGFQCVIAPSFGDIFAENCVRNGMLPIILPRDAVRALASQSEQGDFTVDLEALEVETPNGQRTAFSVDPLHRQSLLEGLDEIELTLKRRAEILEWQARNRLAAPWVWKIG